MADTAVARRYAQAYVNALESSRRIDAGLSELSLLSETYGGSKDLRRFLGSPEIGSPEKWDLLSRLFSERVGPEMMGLLSLLVRWDRVDHLPVIATQARAIAEARQGIVRGLVTTAHPISSAEVSAISGALGKALGRKVLLERALDTHLIGGVRIAVGTTLLDGSVKSFLHQVREQLIQAKVN